MDSVWFYQQLEKEGRSLSAMARALGLDKSAVSRMLRGERKMTAEEQDGIADYLGLSLLEVAERRRGQGFAERGQEPLTGDLGVSHSAGLRTDDRLPVRTRNDVNITTAANFYDRARGCMKGTVTIPPSIDLTEPADSDWGKALGDD
jgi:transcriptional regulator with XRE-family HTH domain